MLGAAATQDTVRLVRRGVNKLLMAVAGENWARPPSSRRGSSATTASEREADRQRLGRRGHTTATPQSPPATRSDRPLAQANTTAVLFQPGFSAVF